MDASPSTLRRGAFAATRWSLVLATADSDLPTARKALTWLCEAYWQPLVDHVRSRGHDPEEAQDAVQDFFARLLEKRDLAPDARRGRFRAYLIGALNHFLANRRDRERARKRGGDAAMRSLEDAHHAGGRTPEQAFTRAWAVTVLQRVLERLERDYRARGRGPLFAALTPSLIGESGSVSHAESAARLGMSEGAVKVAVHRLRSRYRELLLQEVAQTVASPQEVQNELRDLMDALRG